RLTASDGTPMPTKTTSPFFSSFAARDTMSSEVVYSAIALSGACPRGRSSGPLVPSEPVIDRLAHLPVGLQLAVAGLDLTDVRRPIGQAVHPLVEVGLEALGLVRDGV